MNLHHSFERFILAASLALLVAPGETARGQESAGPLAGFGRTVSGTTMAYDSPISTAGTALIARATDGTSSFSWETAAVPASPGSAPASFVWLAGLGCNLGEKRFTLSINGAEELPFTTSALDSWEITARQGVRLTFQTVTVDRHGDRFGFMLLSLPPTLARPGAPVGLRITGSAAGSSAWVMTFTTPLTEGVTAFSRPVILRNGGRPIQPLDLQIINLGARTTGVLSIPGMPDESIDLPFGITSHAVHLTPVSAETTLRVSLDMGRLRSSITAAVTPVRHWTVYLVQHTHTDIGYTRPQADILAEHLRYIDYALDYCDQTDSYPEEARFRWTCETSWAVQEYLRVRPARQIERLKRRVQEGRIELTGMLLNWAEVADENTLAQSLEPIATFRQLGLPVRTAMQDDVNGYAWCLVDYLENLGIRYVTSGINAARALKPFTVPTPFWWESPSGKRVLAYRADHYMTGNFFGIHTDNFALVARDLPAYLRQLETDGYPYTRINVQHSGYSTDNSPPSTYASENVRRWNQTFEWPKLRTATVHEFLEWVEREHGKTLPVFRAAWPDWWTDGYGCAVRETAADRQTQVDLIANQGLLSMAQLFGSPLPQSLFQQMRSVTDNLQFYNEHTFGAAESISDPLAENSQVQWSEKASYPWQAMMQSRILREGAMGQLQEFLPRSSDPCIVVFNTLNWPRSGLHILYIDNQILPREHTFRIIDDRDRDIPVQLVQSRPEGNTWALWVNDIPPLGYATYRLLTTGETRTEEPPFAVADTIQNSYFRLTLDRSRGTISGLFDRELGVDLLDPARTQQLGEFIYERLSSRRSLEEHRLGEHTREGLTNVRFSPGVDGPIWQSLLLSGSSKGFSGANGVCCEIRLFKTTKRIDLLFKARKLPVNDPEAVYVAFPFSLQQGTLLFEAQGGMVQPGVNQLPGTATDWNTVQNFAALRGPAAQIVLVSDEIPLMQFGAINTGRFTPGARPATQQIYSWVLNNYWTTNFRSSQEGEMSWSYSLTSGRDTSNAFATWFGWGVRVPLVSRVLPKAAVPSKETRSRSTWPFTRSTLLLVSSRPDSHGIILHLREIAGASAELTFNAEAKDWRMEEVNTLGDPLHAARTVAFRPFETRFVRIWNDREPGQIGK